MSTRWNTVELILVMLIVTAGVAPVTGQQCDDGNACTSSDMCVSEECVGTPATTGSCDDGNDCTINDRCVPLSPTERDGCMGDPAPVNTDCQGGCGTCQFVSENPVPGAPVFCMAKPDIADQPCDARSGVPCTDDRCRVLAGNFVSCSRRSKVCPDTDGNPCTDACDPETGECSVDAPRCIPVCQQCNPGNGRCEPANLGAACDDSDVCTEQSRCELIEGFSLCRPGEPTAFTPTATPPVATVPPTPTGPEDDTPTPTEPEDDTPTPTEPEDDTPTPTVPEVNTPTPTFPVANTATPTGIVVVIDTPTATPTQGACVGDCNHDMQVRVNELILGTNIALDLAEVSECPEFDPDNDGDVEVDELVLAINNALNGCGAALTDGSASAAAGARPFAGSSTARALRPAHQQVVDGSPVDSVQPVT